MPTSTYDLIASTTLNSTTTDFGFYSIPQTYSNLVVWLSLAGTANSYLGMRISSDLLSDYAYVNQFGYQSGASSGQDMMLTRYETGVSPNFYTSVGGNLFIMQFNNYTKSNAKSFYVKMAYKEIEGSGGVVLMGGGTWQNGSAITSLQFFPISGSFISGTKAWLYGLAGA